jgi:magnesium transporter
VAHAGRRAQKRRRAKISPKRRSAPGTAPGTLTADPQASKPVVRIIAYNDKTIEEHPVEKLDEIPRFLEKFAVTWINIDGLGDVELVRKIGEIFNLHALALEDVLNVHQRAKSEQYGEHQFIVLRMAASAVHLETEQVSIFLGNRFVITFQEDIAGDSFEPVRVRLRKGGTIRKLSADYLAYALIDAIVDHYFPVLEHYGERLDHLEDLVITSPSSDTLDVIHQIKRDLLSLRKAFWPLREAVNSLVRDPSPLIREETRIYLRDVHDHIIQVIDIVETYREIASGLMDVYLSSVSNRMNEVMKLLTIIATIFIPLTFIAGIYGMNFNPEKSPWNMPELNWYWGYPFSLALMALTAIALLIYFQRKGWLRRDASKAFFEEMDRAANKASAQEQRTTGVHPM